jgi:hypothetical protein
MNQGIAFARTIRALDADDFGRSKVTLAIAVILLGAWTWWMLAARIPQYESTTDVHLESSRAIAYFSSTDQIRPGQAAFVTVGNDTIPARVQAVASDRAELVFTNNQQPTTTSTPSAARVEVSSVSPATIALRALGRGNPRTQQ